MVAAVSFGTLAFLGVGLIPHNLLPLSLLLDRFGNFGLSVQTASACGRISAATWVAKSSRLRVAKGFQA